MDGNTTLTNKEAKTIKVVTLVSWLVMFIVLLGGSVAAYWAFTGHDALQFKHNPLPTQPKIVKEQGTVYLDANFCKVTNARGRLVQSFVSDKTTVFAPIVSENQPKGCYHYTLPVPIPPQLAPDKYHIDFRVTYQTNPFHTITETVDSEEFQVIQ